MDFFVNNWPLILLACVSGGMLFGQTMGGGLGGGVPVTEAVRLLNREKGVLIDVSEPAEYAQGHPVGAKNVPFGQIESSNHLPSNKALPIILACPTGSRAARAAGLLKKAGYSRAVAVTGGVKAWREANLPTEKSA